MTKRIKITSLAASLNRCVEFSAAILLLVFIASCSDSGVSQQPANTLDAGQDTVQLLPEPGAAETTTTTALAAQQQRTALYEQFAKRAVDGYSGIREAQPQTLASSGALLNSLLIGMAPDPAKTHHSNLSAYHWAFQPWKRLRQLPLLGSAPEKIRNSFVQGAIECSRDGTGGHMMVSGEQIKEPIDVIEPEFMQKIAESHFKFNIDYHQCQSAEDQPLFNGTVEVHFTVAEHYFDDRDFYTNIVYTYDGLNISYDNQTVSIIGALSIEDGNDCGERGEVVHSILTRHHETGREILLDNVKYGWHPIVANDSDANENQCWHKDLRPDYFTGQLVHSEYGSVTVSTANSTGESGLSGARADFPDIDLENQFGKAEFRTHLSDHYHNPYIHHWTTLSYLESGTDTAEFVQQQQLNFIKGGYADLSDSDADGMTNSWEMLYELDPHDASDANIDLDRDNINNVIEHDTRGDPHRNDIRGISGDAHVEVELSQYNNEKRIRVKIERLLPGVFHDYYAEHENSQQTLVVVADVAGEWQEVPEHCSVDSINQLLCNVWAAPTHQLSRFYYLPDHSGDVAVSAILALAKWDTQPQNNQMTAVLTFLRNEYDFSIDVPAQVSMTTSAITEIIIRPRMEPGDDPATLLLTINIPPNVNLFRRKTYINDIRETGICTFNSDEGSTVMTCRRINTSPDDNMEFVFEAQVREPGEYQLNWELFDHPNDVDHSNNSAVTMLTVTDP